MKVIPRRVTHPFLYSKHYCRYQILKMKKAIPDKEMEAHTYLVGKTGSGKSSRLQQWIYGTWYATRKKEDATIIFLDPHGDTVETIKKFDLAGRYFDRMVYVDPFLMKGNTPTINPLECRESESHLIELQAQQLVRAFEEMMPDTKLSNYMRALLQPCLYTLLTLKDCHLGHLQDFVSGDNDRLVKEGRRSSIPSYKKFFEKEFANPHYRMTKSSIYTKLQSLLNSQVFYYMTNGTSTINLDQLIRQGKIILFNLSKGKIGEEVSETLGRFIIAQVKNIALKRARLPPHLRKKIYLIIDEADTFIKGDSLNVILKETRKYGLHLILATQNLVSGKEQEKLKRNLMNNTNVKIIGANGFTTLKPLSQETGLNLKDLQYLRSHHFWIKYGAHKGKKIKTKNVFGSGSPLLLKKNKVLSLTHRAIKETGYYKPISKPSAHPDERIHDLPSNIQERVISESYPKPKFSF